MCGESRTYRCYPDCTLGTNTGGFLNRLLGSTTNEPGPHKITIRTIQLCQNASNKDPDRTCGRLTDITPSGTVKRIAWSEFAGECPACVEAENAVAKAVEEACFKTVWVRHT